jgi:beta-glucosidase-like glycosyl hydrolase
MRRPVRAAVVLCAVLPLLLASCGGHASRSSSATTSSGRPSRTSSSAASSAASSSAPAPPTTTAPAGDAAVEAALSRMDPRQRVAQLFVVGVPLTALASGDALVQQGVGGVFLAGRSTASTGDLGTVTGRWAAEAPGPRPWVAADQEGGQVQTLKGPGFGLLPSALDQGRLPPQQLAALADGMGASLQSAGVTLDLAPVADVVPAGTEHANAPIGFFDRQYGSTPQQVGAAAGTVVDGLGAHRVTAALKHFPGLGRVTANTDTTAGVTDGVTTADDPQVALFGALAGRPAAPMVMVSLAIYSRIDGTQPAAFSPVVVTDLLRGRLGYRGPVISDDLGKAVAVAAVAPGDRAVRFLGAGGTLVLTVVPAQLGPMIDAVTARAAADPAFAARIDAAVRTDLLAKEHAGLLGG